MIKSKNMKKQLITLFLFLVVIGGYSQSAKDLFVSNNVNVIWLGIDFSHVKLIGNFSEFSEAGQKSTLQIRDIYFPRWNKLILDESSKYDFQGMLRLDKLSYDIDMLMDINSKTELKDIESYNIPNYSKEYIQEIVSQYKLDIGNGIGILFFAECLNKSKEEAYFHFVAINLETKEILIHERLMGKPGGFGLRNFWAGSIYKIIKDIKNWKYNEWKYTYMNN